jgi:hypothetical protein
VPEYEEEMKDEIPLMLELDHPNIQNIYACSVSKKEFISIVME